MPWDRRIVEELWEPQAQQKFDVKACRKAVGRSLMRLPIPSNDDPDVLGPDEIERRWVLSKCRACGRCAIGRAAIIARGPSRPPLQRVR